MADQQRRQLGLAEPHADPVAGHPGLGNLELCLADPVPVADAYLVVRQPVDCEVLPELAVAEVVAAEMLLPVPVRLDLVDQHGPLLAAVTVEVPWPVTVDVQPAHHDRPVRPVSFQMPVCTVLPCQATSRGSPTFTDSKAGMLCASPARYAVTTPNVQVYFDLFRDERDHAGDMRNLGPEARPARRSQASPSASAAA